MKTVLIISIVNFIIGCSNYDKSGYVKDSSRGTQVIVRKDTLTVVDYSKNGLSDKYTTITVSYAAISCGCPQWFEDKFKNVEFLEGVERFYLEPTNKDLINANDMWDGEHLPFTVKITGRFSKEKEIPVTYSSKETLEKARIFWYDRIMVVSVKKRKGFKILNPYQNNG